MTEKKPGLDGSQKQEAKRREIQELSQERISRQRKAVSSLGGGALGRDCGMQLGKAPDDRARGKGRCPNRYALVSLRSQL